MVADRTLRQAVNSSVTAAEAFVFSPIPETGRNYYSVRVSVPKPR